jgi:hypothetical protein
MKACPGGTTVVPESSACPPSTKRCPDGHVVPIDELCDPAPPPRCAPYQIGTPPDCRCRPGWTGRRCDRPMRSY